MGDQGDAGIGQTGHDGTHLFELAYTEVIKAYEVIFEFRTKLLGLLPLVTGTSIFLLLEQTEGPNNATLRGFLGPIGILGVVVTAGLFLCELRGMQRCHRLEVQGSNLEMKLGLGPELGPFRGQPPRAIRNMVGPPATGLIIYLASAFAWLGLAGYGFKWSIHLGLALVAFGVLLTGSWIGIALWLKRTAFGRPPMKWEIPPGLTMPPIRPRDVLQVQLAEAFSEVTKWQDEFKNAKPSRQRDLAREIDQAEVAYLTTLHETLLKSRTPAAQRKNHKGWRP